MPTRPFDNSQFPTGPIRPFGRSLEMSSYTIPLARPGALHSRILDREAEWPDETVVDIRLLGRGVCWALAIEGAAAFCIFLAWHLWMFLR